MLVPGLNMSESGFSAVISRSETAQTVQTPPASLCSLNFWAFSLTSRSSSHTYDSEPAQGHHGSVSVAAADLLQSGQVRFGTLTQVFVSPAYRKRVKCPGASFDFGMPRARGFPHFFLGQVEHVCRCFFQLPSCLPVAILRHGVCTRMARR